MDQAVKNLDAPMTVVEFLACDPPDDRMWQLVDGTPPLALRRNTGLHPRAAA